MILAGGRGARLGPLTCHRAKPAVPFGGRYRIIDFVLSNFVNAGYRRIYVLTQFMASSLIKHLNRNWHLSGLGDYVEVVPAQMRMGAFWYRGTADAVYQNYNLVRDAGADAVAVFGGDHIYKFDIAQMEQAHRDRSADLTVAVFPVPKQEAHQFGIIHVDESGRITGFLEKPSDPPTIPGRPDWCLVSMGNYFFRADVLEEALIADCDDDESRHDFGHNIIPRLLAQGARAYAYDFAENQIVGEPENTAAYWRDVGTIDSYFLANMDLRSQHPALNMYNRTWRIHTAQRNFPPARFIRSEGRSCDVDDSLVCEGSLIAGASLREVLVSYDCMVQSGAEIESSLLMAGCHVGAGARLRRVLLDKNSRVDPGVVIGEDPEADRQRFPFVTESGIVVIPKGTYIPADGPIQLAYDVEFLLRNNDAGARATLDRFQDRYTISDRDRHSYVSAGPRYRRTEEAPAEVQRALLYGLDEDE